MRPSRVLLRRIEFLANLSRAIRCPVSNMTNERVKVLDKIHNHLSGIPGIDLPFRSGPRVDGNRDLVFLESRSRLSSYHAWDWRSKRAETERLAEFEKPLVVVVVPVNWKTPRHWVIVSRLF